MHGISSSGITEAITIVHISKFHKMYEKISYLNMTLTILFGKMIFHSFFLLQNTDRIWKTSCLSLLQNLWFLKDSEEMQSDILITGSLSSTMRTSLKMQLLFHVLEHSNFPALSLPESCLQTDKFPQNRLHSSISIICECAHFVFGFPSRRPIFCGAAFKSILFRLSVSE